MFDLIIMLSRYLFIFYIVLFLWQGIVYVAYEQGGFLGNPYTAVSMQRRITVLMHMTAFLILGYNRETYMFDITTLLFGAVSLVFLLFAVKLLDRFYYEGCPLIWTGMLFLMDVSLIILQRVEPSLAHRQLMWMCIGLAGMSFLPTFFRWIPRFEMFEWVYIIGCYLLLLSTRFFGVSKYGSTNWLAIGPGYLSALGDCKVSVCILPCERIPQEGGMEAVSDNGNFERRTGDAVGFAEGLGQCAYLFYDIHGDAVYCDLE